jgi:transposase
MAHALSMDLRLRVVAAIGGGMSCRQAAARFGVSAASAIRWRQLERRQGSCAPQKLGGDRRSGRIEAEAAFILGEVAAMPDITLAELAERLRRDRELSVGIATIWRFFQRRGITLKKRQRMLPSRTVLTS